MPLSVLAMQEKCREADYDLAMKTEECKRLQEQQNAFSALVSTLEADLGTATASMSDARNMVMGNRQAMKEQKSWIQGAIIREEEVIRKYPASNICWLVLLSI